MTINERNHSERDRGDMTVREAGQKGGEARKQELGPEGYSDLGKQGVEALREQRGPDAMSEIGQRGGEARKEELGPEGYSELGKQGGHRVSELVEKGKQSEGE